MKPVSMHSTAWIRIAGRGLSNSFMPWSLRMAPIACRGPLPASNFDAGAPHANRGIRMKHFCTPKEVCITSQQQGTESVNDAASDCISLSTAGSTFRASRSEGKATNGPIPVKPLIRPKSKLKIPELEPQLQPSQAESLTKPVAAADTAATTGFPATQLAAAAAFPPPPPPPKPRTRRSKASIAAAAAAISASTAAVPAPLPAGVAMDACLQNIPAPSITTGRSTQQPAPAIASDDRTLRRTVGTTSVLLIIDGNYLANRSFFGYGGGRGLSTSSGIPTTVTYGVMRVLQAALRNIQPTCLAVVFDAPGHTFRSVMSILDPDTATSASPAAAGPAAAAAELVRQGKLDWQVLASRLLRLAPVLTNMRAAAAAEAAATPVSYLHYSGFFLPPSPAATAPPPPSSGLAASDSGERQPLSPLTWLARGEGVRGGTGRELLEMLLAALGPELAEATGLAGAFDTAAATATLTPSYKAGRISKGDVFHTDLSNLQRLLGLMSVPPLARPGLEADDLAGLLVQQAVQHGMAVRILSGDRDLMQLVSDPRDVALLYPMTSLPAGGGSGGRLRGGISADFPFVELREADVVSALGVPPALVADYKALVGDNSDCLPGVRGIGRKTAASLLALYGSLGGIHRAIAEMTPKRRAALQSALPSSQYTLTMARVLGTPGSPALPAGVLSDRLLRDRLQLQGYDTDAVHKAFLELEMRSLARAVGPGGELWEAFGGGRQRL